MQVALRCQEAATDWTYAGKEMIGNECRFLADKRLGIPERRLKANMKANLIEIVDCDNGRWMELAQNVSNLEL